MTDYISRAEAIELMSGSNIEDHLDSVPTSEPRRYARAAQRVIWSIPAADVVPVVHGRWIYKRSLLLDGQWRHSTYWCSVCDEWIEGVHGSNYCPHCGAKMDGGPEKCEAQKRDLENVRRSMEEAIATPVVDVTRWQYPQLTKEAKQKV